MFTLKFTNLETGEVVRKAGFSHEEAMLVVEAYEKRTDATVDVEPSY